MEKRRILLGIDLGSSRTSVVSSEGYRGLIPSVVGYPRDIIAVKMLGKTQVFGTEALAEKRALVLYRPLFGLAAGETKRDYNATCELLRHVLELALGVADSNGAGDEAANGETAPSASAAPLSPAEIAGAGDGTDSQPGGCRPCVDGIIGVPARITEAERHALRRLVSPLFTNVMVVSQPYLVAYRLQRLNASLIVDLGAGAVTVCAIRGGAPTARDQAILPKAGDYLDERLQEVVGQSYPEVRISLTQARQIKERYAFVGTPPEPVVVTLRARGKPKKYDLTSELGSVCAGVVPDIVERLIGLLQEFEPEDQERALQNIYLTGGGSGIKGLAPMIAAELSEYGAVEVHCVNDPDYAGAEGALRLAQELSVGDWREFGL